MDLQTRFKSHINEMSVTDVKTTYKDLLKIVTSEKSSIAKSIKLYEKDSLYGKAFMTMGKNKDRKAIIEAFKLVQEELERVNV